MSHSPFLYFSLLVLINSYFIKKYPYSCMGSFVAEPRKMYVMVLTMGLILPYLTRRVVRLTTFANLT